MGCRMDYRIVTGQEGIQGTPEWLAYRRTHIMASDMPILMGESPFKTVAQLYAEKANSLETVCSPAMQRGKDLEPAALEWFNSRRGPPYFSPAVIESLASPLFGASLDGLRMVYGKTEVLEIKCAGEKDHLEAMGGFVPVKYRAQLDHILFVSGAKFCWYLSFDGISGIILHYMRDQKREQLIVDKGLSFLAIMLSHTPPEPSDKDETEIVDPEAFKVAKKYLEVCKDINMLEQERDHIKSKLIDYSKSSRTAIGPIMLRREERDGAIDYRSIPAISGLDLEMYRKPKIVCWKITERKEDTNG